MGDSHTLIFHDPLLFARGAGLPDHLALRLGLAVDLVGVRGSGATSTRIELLRRKDNLEGKKLVIWCFSFREFTESTTGWRKVPVVR
jgi:alginate O-acetyltransferase complex protein AlgJ